MDQVTLQIPGVVIGEIVGAGEDGNPLVRWGGNSARAAQPVWTPAAVDWARCRGKRALLGFIDGDELRPVVLGLLDAPTVVTSPAPETLRIESQDELVIECGKSKIALRADGRIEIRGGHVISRSSGPNKIKGATVHIN